MNYYLPLACILNTAGIALISYSALENNGDFPTTASSQALLGALVAGSGYGFTRWVYDLLTDQKVGKRRLWVIDQAKN